jgi:hypothetical protein
MALIAPAFFLARQWRQVGFLLFQQLLFNHPRTPHGTIDPIANVF